jgi:BON domain-containing protein
MPTPIDIITKPLQIGAQITTRTIEEVVKRFTGGEQEEPPQPHQKLQREEQARQGQRPAGQRRQARPKPLDDVTITRKVESVLFREQGVDKGKISVNTTEGVVWLRGEAKTPEQIKELEAAALAIPEVKQVENLLHLPKTPAPAKARRSKGTPAAARKRTPKRTTAERKTPASAKAEPSPRELAAKHEGRQPAPLGSSGGPAASGNGSSGSTTS